MNEHRGNRGSSPVPIVLIVILAAAILIMAPGCAGPARGGGAATDAAGADDGTGPYGTTLVYAAHTESVRLSPAYMKELEERFARGRSSGWLDADMVDAVVADGTITADEMNDLDRRAVACLAKYGFEVNRDYWFSPTGGISTFGSKVIQWNEDHNQPQNGPPPEYSIDCLDNGYGDLANMYWRAYANPNNVDLDPYVFQCFVEHGLVKDGITYERYRTMAGADALVGDPARSTSSTHGIWNTCWDDPLHNIADSPLAG